MPWKRIIVTPISEIIEYSRYFISHLSTKCSEQINAGQQVTDFTKLPTDDVGEFLSMLRFEYRARLAELGINLAAL